MLLLLPRHALARSANLLVFRTPEELQQLGLGGRHHVGWWILEAVALVRVDLRSGAVDKEHRGIAAMQLCATEQKQSPCSSNNECLDERDLWRSASGRQLGLQPMHPILPPEELTSTVSVSPSTDAADAAMPRVIRVAAATGSAAAQRFSACWLAMVVSMLDRRSESGWRSEG